MAIAAHTVLQLGLLYGIATLSGVVSFRFLRFPDLTVDGSFVLGAAVTAISIRNGVHPLLAVLVAVLAGFLAGTITAIWHRAFGINKFFAGILTMMMLYSVNLRVLGGANISLLNESSIFESSALVSDWQRSALAVVSFGLAAIIAGIVFCSRLGLQVRAIGTNRDAFGFTGQRLTVLTMIGLGFANSLAAVSGSLIAQYQRFADVGMGLGIIVNIFASLFLGEALALLLLSSAVFIFKSTAFAEGQILHSTGAYAIGGELMSAGIGMVAFMAIITATLYLGLEPSDTKMCAALLLCIGLIWRRRGKSSFLVVPGEYEK